MPALAPSGPILGQKLASAAQSKDAVGIAAWTSIGTVMATWIQAAAVFVPMLRTPLVAVAAVITGTGGLTFSAPPATLGMSLASAAGSVDAAGIAKWNAVASAIVSWFTAHGGVDPSTLIGFVGPAPGAVTGFATIAFDNTQIGPTLAAAAGSTDTAGIAAWDSIGGALLEHVATVGTVMPGTLVNPGTGGPVTGASAIL